MALAQDLVHRAPDARLRGAGVGVHDLFRLNGDGEERGEGEEAETEAELKSLPGRGTNLARARSMFEEALAIRERSLGPERPLVGATRTHLSLVLAKLEERRGR